MNGCEGGVQVTLSIALLRHDAIPALALVIAVIVTVNLILVVVNDIIVIVPFIIAIVVRILCGIILVVVFIFNVRHRPRGASVPAAARTL